MVSNHGQVIELTGNGDGYGWEAYVWLTVGELFCDE